MEQTDKTTAERVMTKAEWDAMQRAKYHLAQAVIQLANAGLVTEACEVQERLSKAPPSYIEGTKIPNHYHP